MDDDRYPIDLIRAQERVTEGSKTWSKGPRFLWGVYLAIGLGATLVGAAGHIPGVEPYKTPELIVSILRNILGI